jgi:RNA polymerase sigma-54 factor
VSALLLQLRRLGKEDSTAAHIVQHHLDELGGKKYAPIAKALHLSLEEVQQAARFIATLEPRPGRLFSAESPAYILPEVVVQKVGDDYVIVMNRDQIPHLRISKHYRQLMESPETANEVKSYIRDKVRAGAFLIKSIGQRQQTIYRIAAEIVKVQRDFFEQGVTALRPLTMAEVAGVLGIHETTVSRAIANKYMQTPRGTFEMKYFFTPGLKTADGKDISNKTIKDTNSQMIANEDPAHPLSDQDMVAGLAESGIKVARRTIAKYREELHILPSHLRKS